MASWLVESVDDPQLRDSVNNLISRHPDSQTVVQALVAYYNAKLSTDEPRPKKRKIDESSGSIIATINDLSFQQPTRKKYNLIVTPSHLQIALSGSEVIENEWPAEHFSLGVYVPTPDKPSHTFALFRKQASEEAIVFTVQDKGSITIKRANQPDETVDKDKHTVIARLLMENARINFTTPDTQSFRSTGVSATTGKPQERYHVNAYLKTKEGSLFFLPSGVLFGFRKPTLFCPLSSISAIAVNSVTQRTFDLTIKMAKIPLGSATKQVTEEEEGMSLPFSMIEQSEYEGINAYINKTGINDRSMDEELKAPEPKSRKDGLTGDGDDTDGRAMDTKAMEEEEEEQDEDFEPSEEEEDPLEYDTDATGEENGDDQVDQEMENEDMKQEEVEDDTLELVSDSD
ncbi:hypothetical protein EC973_000266 [Apophysomyces ossiformis]|uniref:Histone chaperone RTT106/FACT complex subunit SPT16-like middle domain-containing protein n=1 Tax=Apophysomyces ossiformis TaxID=679940 RepID=A0A8H7BYI7_9FUNG|nr:hypothetical protein EC973_000266 [Apophysomyces ossiformis]